MGMMQISVNNKNNHQRGVTLFELLIVLAIIALMTTITSANIRGASAQNVVKAAAQKLRADLIRARTKAHATNSSIRIKLNDTGYEIPALNINRVLPRKMQVIHDGGDVIIIGSGSWLRGYKIQLKQRNTTASISIAPLTREIEINNE